MFARWSCLTSPHLRAHALYLTPNELNIRHGLAFPHQWLAHRAK
jgi:hypothetical protein